MTRRTKIVATIGPATESPLALEQLLRAGVDVVRLNLSHGSVEEHLHRLQLVRHTSARLGRVVAVLADLPGPKVRAGAFHDTGVFLMEGAALRLVPGEEPSTGEVVTVDYPTLLDDVSAGDHIVLGDGAISLLVASVADGAVHAVVVTGGRVQGRPGVHLPSERLRLTTPTEQDLELAAVMTEAEVDFLAVSFVRRADDLRKVRAVVGDDGPRLVAKIETAPAVAVLDEILEVCDALMVARGDLGIECPLEDVPHLQKQIIRAAVEAGVPVITATQMLESMITAPAPTRAEVSDVANAVFDGTDAVMLSAETAIGHDPALVVRTMARVAARAESEASYRQWASRLGRMQRRQWPDGPDRITMAITHAASQAATDAGVDLIVCCTRSGRTARAMARFRPTADLIGISPDARTTRTLALSWGVIPMTMITSTSTDELVWLAVEGVVKAGHADRGDLLLVLAGSPDKPSGGATDVLRIVRIE
jgi:pyruvate kinase